jgi:hypothetical protein
MTQTELDALKALCEKCGHYLTPMAASHKGKTGAKLIAECQIALTQLIAEVEELGKENGRLLNIEQLYTAILTDGLGKVMQTEIGRLVVEINKTRERLTDFQKDKERLDWIQNSHARFVCYGNNPAKLLVGGNDFEGITLRQAIDAAIAAEKK